MRHVANDLAAKANTEKKAKTFEEMVPEWCWDFKDLFGKENFDELPEPKPGIMPSNSSQTPMPTWTARFTRLIERAGRARQIPQRKPVQWENTPVQVTHGFTILLR